MTLKDYCQFMKVILKLSDCFHCVEQAGLGGCIYVLECCISSTATDATTIQWLNGRLLTMKELLEDFPDKFTTTNPDSEEFVSLADEILLPIVEFAVKALSRSAIPQRTAKYSKRVILQCAK